MLQSDIIDFLSKPEAYGLAAQSKVVRFDTHISIVFLAGSYAYKLKRAIKLPFVDFCTVDDRKKYCLLELEVNQNGAADLYLDVVPVTLSETGLSLNGTGEPVDWLVKMERFEQDDLFESLCNENRLSIADIERTTDHIIDVYKQAPIVHSYGGADGIVRAFEGHYKAFDNCPSGILPKERLEQLSCLVDKEISKQSALLNDRKETGFVRQCHGDLHLRNICLFKGRVTLFDAIEFEPDYANIDVFYDLSFLIMDLCHRKRMDMANAVLNRYLGITGDIAALHVFGLFLSSRAAIRTHVNAVASANQNDDRLRVTLEKDARNYLNEAISYLKPVQPVLVAIGGLSGTGKSILAKKLAPDLGKRPGAYIARTDMIRKRIMGVKPEEKLNQYGYSQGVTSHTYNTLYVEIRLALHAGYSVVVDGVFAKSEERQMLKEIASAMDVPFIGLWLEAPQASLKDRVEKRKNDVSDADVKIVEMQSSYDIGQMDWKRIDASMTVENVYRKARNILNDFVDLMDE